jgi:hypothetical protein
MIIVTGNAGLGYGSVTLGQFTPTMGVTARIEVPPASQTKGINPKALF